MKYILTDREPKVPLRYFEEISQIPRGSRNEKAVSEYFMAFAEAHGLEAVADELFNVVIKKPGQGGGENAAPVALQGHSDMVCEKNNDVDHDFLTDPIAYYLDGDQLRAKGTTLGSDNASACSIMLAILEDKSIPHPPLECIFTAQEEVGLVGAIHLDPALISARRMLNMDCGPEGTAVVGSAGGKRVNTFFQFEKESVVGEVYQLEVKGLAGGHSGGEIHKYKGNANKLMARLLRKLLPFGVHLCSITGGSKENAIARECVALISLPDGKKPELDAVVAQAQADFKAEFAGLDDGVVVVAAAASADYQMDAKATQALVNYMLLYPHGVQFYSQELMVTVASQNMGVVEVKGDSVLVASSLRSSVDSLLYDMRDRLLLLAELFGASITEGNAYPSWSYDRESPLRDLAKEQYKQLFGSELNAKPVHGGLECGVFKQKFPNMDIIAIGPSASGAHSPDETLNLPSYARMFDFVKAILKKMCG